MNGQEVISLKEYIDSSVNGLKAYFTQHFELNDTALKLANDGLFLELKEIRNDCVDISKRVKALEESKAFSAGKTKMVMALFAAIPTVLALIALFRG